MRMASSVCQMTYDRAQLEAAFRAQRDLKFLFFWGHQPAKDGRITPSCFSQWWPAPFTVDNVRYPTAEHWMMAEKARLFSDSASAARILAAESPRSAKQLGRQVRGFDEALWDREKWRIVSDGSRHKFKQNKLLGDFLLSTGELILVEASPVDPVWGIGLSADDDRARNPTLWRGENLLGFALMVARDTLRAAGAA